MAEDAARLALEVGAVSRPVDEPGRDDNAEQSDDKQSADRDKGSDQGSVLPLGASSSLGTAVPTFRCCRHKVQCRKRGIKTPGDQSAAARR
jgi:hypothetical protein